MRRLILMRHAKSDWDSGALSDRERPLSARGRRDAPRVASRLRELGWVPERVLCSDAVRAVQTWEGMRPVLGERPLTLDPALYHAGTGALSAALSALEDRVRCVLVVGHNPGWEEALAALTGQAHTLTTANAALLEAPTGSGGEGSWAGAVRAEGAWRCVRILRPRELDP